MRQLPRTTVTLTNKYQLTVPAWIVRQHQLQPGTKIDIHPLGGEEFVARVRRPSRILDFAGDLKGWALEKGAEDGT